VPANAAKLRFFVDESSLAMGKILAIAREDVIHTGHPLMPEVPVGTLDPDWIPAVAARGLAVISRDKRIRTKPAELELFRQHQLRAFWIAGKRDLDNWQTLGRLVRRWDDIEEALRERGPGPWFYAINESGLKEIPV
jgi:hypothetical protein